MLKKHLSQTTAPPAEVEVTVASTLKKRLSQTMASLRLYFSPNNPKLLLKAGIQPRPIGPLAHSGQLASKTVHFAETPTLYRSDRNGHMMKIKPQKVKALYGKKVWGAYKPENNLFNILKRHPTPLNR